MFIKIALKSFFQWLNINLPYIYFFPLVCKTMCVFVLFWNIKSYFFYICNILCIKVDFLFYSLSFDCNFLWTKKRCKITKWKCQKLLFFFFLWRRMIFYLKRHILYHFRCVKKTYFLNSLLLHNPFVSRIYLYCVTEFLLHLLFSLEYHFFWDIKGVKFMSQPQILLLLFTVIYVFVYYHILCCLC